MKDETRFQRIAERLDHLPLGVRLFGKWSQARYQREVAAMTKAMKASLEAARTEALQSGLPSDPALANQKFRTEYLAATGACDEAGIAQRIFADWELKVDVADEFVLQSNDQYPRGLLGTVRLVLLELERIPADDASACRQSMSILALCPPISILHGRCSSATTARASAVWST